MQKLWQSFGKRGNKLNFVACLPRLAAIKLTQVLRNAPKINDIAEL